MGIDGIKSGGIPTGPTPESVGGVSGEKGSFELAPTEASAAATDLDKLAAGELSLDQYLDARVTQATSHLQTNVPTEQLELIREELRGMLEVDPVLVRLARRASGSSSLGESGSGPSQSET